jgi:hypothetical protein
VRADAAAAREDGDPAYVAEVLCRHARMATAAEGALGLGGAELDARVRSLLDGRSPDGARFPTSLGFYGLAAACLAGHVAHRVFEALLMLLQ